ncbi:hypothetical protein SJAV_00170 [Sulfurisphaera javensis]|uniref:SpoVT-AbrB domain-containing protein n=1 Tax=Sulfurisphaera javensis TaxID=2049879 RepID=A0AAT9GMY4_9CREN
MTIKVNVGKKGIIIIPKSIRDLLNIKEGDSLLLNVIDGKIVLERERKINLEDLKKKFEEHEKRIAYAKKPRLGELEKVELEEEFEG